MASLDFSHAYSYRSTDAVTLPVALRSGREMVDVLATVDTGASACLFERQHGESLKLDIETGQLRTFKATTGRVTAFGHLVSLEFFDLRFESLVYFFADPNIDKNLLGRKGWLDRIRFGLVDHDTLLYLAAYDFDQ